MNEKKDNKYIRLIIIEIFVALILWALLIVLRGCGVIDLHWALTLSSLVWNSWGLFSLTALLAQAEYLIRRARRPKIHSSEELEREAWKDFKIVREPGETDQHLAARCMHAATGELLNELEKEPEE